MPKTRGKTGAADLVYSPVYPSMAINDPGADELITIWTALDERGRDGLIVEAGFRLSNSSKHNSAIKRLWRLAEPVKGGQS